MRCRYNDGSRVQGGIQGQLEQAHAAFKEIERKDIKVREDVKHLKAKLKKLGDKLGKDTTKAEVRISDVEMPYLQHNIEGFESSQGIEGVQATLHHLSGLRALNFQAAQALQWQ
jgi:predicted  nucleic acid-binding Zn-ribbon protein